MNYAKILRADVVNSCNGFGCTLFVSGCSRGCKGCFNPEAWDCNFGKPFDDDAKQKIFDELSKDYCKAFSFLGGEPMSKLSDNRKVVMDLAKEIKEKFPDITIYMWSGYTFEEISSADDMKDILKYIDVLVDGPFMEEQKDLSLSMRGSLNQRVLDIKEYRKSGELKMIS